MTTFFCDQCSARVLVVDDDQNSVVLLSKLLMVRGADVIIAQDGISAISKARQKVPDLVILGLGLPSGSGFYVLKCLRDMPALLLVPIIAISSATAAQAKRRGFPTRSIHHAQAKRRGFPARSILQIPGTLGCSCAALHGLFFLIAILLHVRYV